MARTQNFPHDAGAPAAAGTAPGDGRNLQRRFDNARDYSRTCALLPMRKPAHSQRELPPYIDDNYSGECDDNPRGWRVTGTLKCSLCKTKTRHALLRRDEDEFRDWAELPLDERRRRIVERYRRSGSS